MVTVRFSITLPSASVWRSGRQSLPPDERPNPASFPTLAQTVAFYSLRSPEATIKIVARKQGVSPADLLGWQLAFGMSETTKAGSTPADQGRAAERPG